MTTKEYRLGGAGGYSVFGIGTGTQIGPVYTEIIVKSDDGRYSKDVTSSALPIWLWACAVDILHLDSLVREARRHLAMGAKLTGRSLCSSKGKPEASTCPTSRSVMDERKSVYAVVDDEQMTRVRSAMEDVTSLVDSLRLGCEIAYRREPTQEEGDAHEHRHDQSMGASHGSGECFVPMGSHHGWKCRCGTWVWGGPTVCQRCVDADAVKIALEWKAMGAKL